MACARPLSSSTVSPLLRSATPNPAIWADVAAPSMISFIAQAASPTVSDSPLMSAPISAGQLARPGGPAGSGTGLQRAAGRQIAHQAGQRLGEGDRIDRVRHHGIRARPGGEPAVVRPPDHQQYRGAVIDLVLGLP